MNESQAMQLLGPRVPHDVVMRPDSLTPLRQEQELEARISYQSRQIAGLKKREDFLRENEEPNAPLDLDSGVSAGLRARLSFERNPEKAVNYLKKQQGVLNARVAKDGQTIIVRMADPKTMFRDVVVDPAGFQAADLAGLAGDVPSVAANIALAGMTGGTSVPAQIAAVAGGTAAVGAAQDAIARRSMGNEVDPSEIAKYRAAEGGLNVAMMGALPAARATANRILSPMGFGSMGPKTEALKKSLAYLNDTLGVDIHPSAAMRTGSPLLAQAETFSEGLPGGNRLKIAADDRLGGLADARSKIAQAPSVSQDGVAAEVTDNAQAIARGMGERINAARDAAAERASKNIIDVAIAKSIGGVPLTRTEAGAFVRAAVKKRREDFTALADDLYAQVERLPEARSAFIDTAPLRNLRKELEKGIVRGADRNDQRQILKRLSDDAAPDIITDLGKLPPKLTLQELKTIKSNALAMVTRSEVERGVADRNYGLLAQAASDALEKAATTAPTKDLREALVKANGFYRDNVGKYQQPGVADLFTPASSRGYIDDDKVVRRIFEGRGDVATFRRYRDLLGENSPDFRALRRAGVDDILDQTRTRSGLIDAQDLITRIQGMDAPFRREALGKTADDILTNAEIMKLARSGGRIDPQAAEALLKSAPKDAGKLLRDAITLEKQKDDYFRTVVMRQIERGEFNAGTLNGDQFATRFMEAASVQDIRRVMQELAKSPESQESIRRHVAASLLDDADKPLKASDVLGTLATGRTTPTDPEKLYNAIVKNEAKYKAVLGETTMEHLRNYLTVSASHFAREEAGGGAGGLVQKGLVGRLLNLEFGDAGRYVKNRVVAWGLTAPGMRDILGSTIQIPDIPRIRQAAFSSPQLAQALTSDLGGPDAAALVVRALERDNHEYRARSLPDGRRGMTEEQALKLLHSRPANTTAAPAAPKLSPAMQQNPFLRSASP